MTPSIDVHAAHAALGIAPLDLVAQIATVACDAHVAFTSGDPKVSDTWTAFCLVARISSKPGVRSTSIGGYRFGSDGTATMAVPNDKASRREIRALFESLGAAMEVSAGEPWDTALVLADRDLERVDADFLSLQDSVGWRYGPDTAATLGPQVWRRLRGGT